MAESVSTASESVTSITLPRGDWLARRPKVVGASEVAVILGKSPFETPFTLWEKKVEGKEIPSTFAMRAGLALEDGIARLFEEESGVEVGVYSGEPGQEESWQNKDYPLVWATPDRWTAECNTLELKNTSVTQDGEWQDGPPIHYIIQVQWVMGATDTKTAYIAALIGNRRLAWYKLSRDDTFLRASYQAVLRFWQCVVSRVPPPAEARDLAAVRRWERREGDHDWEWDKYDALAAAAERLTLIRSSRAQLDHDAQEVELSMRNLMGDAKRVFGPDGSRVTAARNRIIYTESKA